jgi:hypothetical protein
MKLRSLEASILLGELLFHYHSIPKDKFLVKENKAWFPLSVLKIQNRLGMTKKKQYLGFSILIEEEIIERKKLGIPGRRYISLNIEKIHEIQRDLMDNFNVPTNKQGE